MGASAEFERDCMKWRGIVLTGKFAHWCESWDGLPVDETTPGEFMCCECAWEPASDDIESARQVARAEWMAQEEEICAQRAPAAGVTPAPSGDGK